jgi:hypothetical protein
MLNCLRRYCLSGVVLLCVWLLAVPTAVPTAAQTNDGVVPDLTGLNLAQATAALNRAGLLVGQQLPRTLAQGDATPQDSIVAQSVAAGAALAVGSAVDITVAGVANVLMLYDDNDFTLVNLTGSTLDLAQVSLQAADGASGVTGLRWMPILEAGDCVQIWSIARNNAKDWEQCRSTQWLTTNNSAEHFWTEANGVQSFSLVLNGVPQVTCPAALIGAQPAVCSLYLPSGVTAATTLEYVYIAYTVGQWALVNRSTDKWLPLNQTRVLNFNPALELPGVSLTLDNPQLFAPTVRGFNTLLLAPGQCVLMQDPRFATDQTPPTDCVVVGVLTREPLDVFWQADYRVLHTIVGRERMCPAATRDKLTVCILPRE